MNYKFVRATNGGRPPGSWKPAVGSGKANLTCPGCNGSMSLCNHAVSSDGVVTPMLVCPNHDCEFEAYAELSGWIPLH